MPNCPPQSGDGCQSPVPFIIGMFVFGKHFGSAAGVSKGMRISSPGKGIKHPVLFSASKAQRLAAPSVGRLCCSAQRLSLIQANGTKADYLTLERGISAETSMLRGGEVGHSQDAPLGVPGCPAGKEASRKSTRHPQDPGADTGPAPC